MKQSCCRSRLVSHLQAGFEPNSTKQADAQLNGMDTHASRAAVRMDTDTPAGTFGLTRTRIRKNIPLHSPHSPGIVHTLPEVLDVSAKPRPRSKSRSHHQFYLPTYLPTYLEPKPICTLRIDKSQEEV
jgi:hypothetical protein